MQERRTNAWPRAVVFDLDGTLIDSVGDLRTALNAVLVTEGLAPQTIDEVRRMLGGGVRVLLQRAHRRQGCDLSDMDAERLAGDFMAVYEPRATETTALYPGAAALLERLAAAGVKLAVCTNKPAAITTVILRDLGILDRFGAVVGLGEGRPRKPDPAMLFEALAALGVAAEEAVMIGDSATDVATARAAGVAIMVVAYGYTCTAPEELAADRVIAALDAVPDALAALPRPASIPQS